MKTESETMDGFSFDRVFSRLETKVRILKDRLHRAPFHLGSQEWIMGRALLGPGCQSIRFEDKDHQQNHKVLTCGAPVNFYKRRELEISNSLNAQDFRRGWQERRNACLADVRQPARSEPGR